MQHISVPSNPILNGSVAAILTFAALFGDTGVAAGTKKVTIRADATHPVLLKFYVEVRTPYNATTANNISVGSTQNGSEFIAAGSITAGTAGFYPASNAVVKKRIVVDTDIYFRASGNFAVQTLTNDGTNVSDGDTVTVGGKVYTFQTTLTNVNGNVKIGGSNTASMTNLFHAINASGGTVGTDYATAMTANTQVIATNPTGTTVVATAIVGGTAGNAIVSTETSSHLSWGAATLAGGTDPTAGDALLYVEVTPLYPSPSGQLS